MYSFVIHYKGDDDFNFITFCANTKKEAKGLFADWCKDNKTTFEIKDIEVFYDENDATEYGKNYGTPAEYLERSRLKERLFWMDLNDGGIDEIGYLMTMEQLCKALPEKDSVSAEQMTPEDVDKLIAESKDGMFEGNYHANCSFIVQEVKDIEELVSLLTWEDYDFTKGATAVELDSSYPDYVSEKFRLSACVYGEEPGWTSPNLPNSVALLGMYNPTVERYAKELGLGMISGLRHNYTDEERAAIEISQALHSGCLSLEYFADTLETYAIKPPAIKAVEIEWDVEEDVELPNEILIPEGMYDEEAISDYLTEVTGYCHKGYLLTEAEEAQKEEEFEPLIHSYSTEI